MLLKKLLTRGLGLVIKIKNNGEIRRDSSFADGGNRRI